MTAALLVGFDSAWTDNQTRPGALSACLIRDGRVQDFYPPVLATFKQAETTIRSLRATADMTLIAIDQPTIVPNDTGARPVDRVLGSLMTRLRGGVQPARRGGLAAPMFGDGAPIWRFRDALKAELNPVAARTAATGCHLIEVFPALTIAAVIADVWERRKAAKYNPANAKFDLGDWRLVAQGIAACAAHLGAPDLAGWLQETAGLQKPRKADQDRLDAAICLIVALAWRMAAADKLLMIGDTRQGAVAAIVSGLAYAGPAHIGLSRVGSSHPGLSGLGLSRPDPCLENPTRACLVAAAARLDVPVYSFGYSTSAISSSSCNLPSTSSELGSQP